MHEEEKLFGARATTGQGVTYVQALFRKIELINPLVTNITFSPSDYSITELRTMDLISSARKYNNR